MKEEYKSLSISEAKSKLEGEDWKEWKRWHNKKIREDAEENKEWLEDSEDEALRTLIQAGKDELRSSVTIQGLDIAVDLNIPRGLILKIKSMRDKVQKINPEQATEEDLKDLEEKIIGLLSRVTPEYDESDWSAFGEENGIVGLNVFGGIIFKHIIQETQKKSGSIKNFRPKELRTSGDPVYIGDDSE